MNAELERVAKRVNWYTDPARTLTNTGLLYLDAPPGLFSRRAWAYWGLILLDDPDRPMPERFPGANQQKVLPNVGTQYRSGIHTYDDDQQRQAEGALAAYQAALTSAGLGSITTEIISAPEFYHAEDCHQQYLAKNPDGHCGIGDAECHLNPSS